MVVLLILLLACSHLTQAAHWAFLVAGSTGYSNYRHQANVCHAYQLMLKSGIPKENIVTMMRDDVAYNPRNPFQGNIINEHNGPNVYAGVKIDYRGRDVSASNFLKVLQGQPTNAGTGRVINSKAGDHIFVYYSDHGNTNILAFPGGMLYSSHLNDAIMNMHRSNRYSKLVFYVEACHSGSMFNRRLPSNVNVYAMTAANPYESSYSCCYDRARRTFLGDVFSGNWMHDSERHSMGERSLWDQYQTVKAQTHTSHVSVYGDTRGMGGMKIGEFQGNKNMYASSSKKGAPMSDIVPTWDVPYLMLLHDLEDANTTASRLEVLHQMQAEQKAHLAIRKTMEDIVKKLSPNPVMMMQVMETQTTEEQDNCYEQSVDKYLQTCTAYQEYDYAMKDLYVFANLCNEGNTNESIKDAIQLVCSAKA